MAQKIDREELRQLIRDALQEALGADPPRSTTGEGDDAKHGGGGRREGGRPVPPPPPPAVPLPRSAGEEPAQRLATGVLTEALVTRLAIGHQKILIGAAVVVTPLARDRARILKVEIVRQQP